MAAFHSGPNPPPTWDGEHNSKRRLIRIVPPIPGLWTCFTHASCLCNELVSSCNRVLGVVPLPSYDGLLALKRMARKLATRCGHLDEWSLERVLESFHGRRYVRYNMAYESLMVNPITAADARINSFVKAEKFNPWDKKNPDPRMIQARGPRYNLHIARFLRPVEHFIYNLTGPSGLRMVAKGLNQIDRADHIIRKFQLFRKPVCFSIDCSRWDKHVSLQVLRIEHAFYRMLFPNSPELDRLLNWQEDNRCRTAGGIKYDVGGGRMSGDINTALGNCLLMIIMVQAAMKQLGVDCEIFDDGDDCLVFIEEENFDHVNNGLSDMFLSYGQELKIENVARQFTEVVFCQSRICWNGEGYIMCRNWAKVLSQSTSGTKHWNDPQLVRPMMGLLGDCELALSAGVPVLQAYALALRRMSRGKRTNTLNLEQGVVYRVNLEGSFNEVVSSARARKVSPKAREVFELAFGVPEWEQIAIEEILNNWDLDSETAIELPVEWSSEWDDNRQNCVYLPEIY